MAKKDVNQNQYINNIPNQNPGLPATNTSGVLASNQIPNAGFVQYPQAVQNKINNANPNVNPNANVINNQNPVQSTPLQQGQVQNIQAPQPQAQPQVSQPVAAKAPVKPQKNVMVTFATRWKIAYLLAVLIRMFSSLSPISFESS